ncbi:MAG TPA: TIGR03668 family PPOX class F420-dependent oxidoreductase, partial [Solirubrobacteraceae bacterium]|nr:TIGR03668 family PPOX class F420-dependent oxidoreductase [Solirubrobacteraceae bacterium]
ARVGRLATVRPDGRPHVVVCCFAVEGDRVWTAVDEKPKRTGGRLQRLENVRANPHASLLVDHYEEDWERLWWVRVDGAAAVLEKGSEEERAIALLTARYPQYARARPGGPVIAIAIERITGWSAR